jgi:hypothetical protein
LTTHDFLYLAVTKEVSQSVFEEEAGQTMIEDGIIRFTGVRVSSRIFCGLFLDEMN